jgi:hypothetical protein
MKESRAFHPDGRMEGRRELCSSWGETADMAGREETVDKEEMVDTADMEVAALRLPNHRILMSPNGSVRPHSAASRFLNVVQKLFVLAPPTCAIPTNRVATVAAR